MKLSKFMGRGELVNIDVGTNKQEMKTSQFLIVWLINISNMHPFTLTLYGIAVLINLFKPCVVS